MAKHNPQVQGAFSFVNAEGAPVSPPEPKRHVLKPPTQIEVSETSTPTTTHDVDIEPDEASWTIQEPETENIYSKEEPIPEAIIKEQTLKVVWETIDSEDIEVPNTDHLSSETLPDPEERKSTRGRKSAREHEIAAANVEMPDDETLFSKHYYSMRDVTAMLKENHSLIRYWETEFDVLKPKKNGKGDRFFRPVDVKKSIPDL